jgi:hypothetical protein
VKKEGALLLRVMAVATEKYERVSLRVHAAGVYSGAHRLSVKENRRRSFLPSNGCSERIFLALQTAGMMRLLVKATAKFGYVVEMASFVPSEGYRLS